VAGALLLGSLGEGAYVPAWYAAVVGAHFGVSGVTVPKWQRFSH